MRARLAIEVAERHTPWIAPGEQSERRVADGACHHDRVARLGAGATHHASLRHLAKRGDRDRHRALGGDRVAAEERAAELSAVRAEPMGEFLEPAVARALPARDGKERTERCRGL